METKLLNPITKARGIVQIPGSKSLSNRVLLLAALAEGETKIRNLLQSDDTDRMLESLRALGVSYDLSDAFCVVQGLGRSFEMVEAELFLGNAGTAMRPLAAALAAGQGTYRLTGEPRMYERPIGHLVEPLRQLGAKISYGKDEGFPPLLIEAEGLSGGEVTIDGAISSQFLTALLMAAPLAEGPVTIHVEGTLVSRPYIDITLHVMEQFGVTVEETGHDTFCIQPATYRAPASVLVEGDASSASYFLALGALLDGPVRVEGVGSESVQGDVKFAEVLDKMGARVTLGPDWIETSGGTLRGLDIDLNHIPDAAMTIATMALFAEGPTVIRNIYNWRVKETDRISAMATELRKVGAEVEEGEDFIAITPPKQLRPATIDTYDDHRMAMCFSLASCGTVPIMINDPGCVAKTFPTYWELFDRVTR